MWLRDPWAAQQWRIRQFWDDASYKAFANFLLKSHTFDLFWSESEGVPVQTCEVGHKNHKLVTL